VNKTVVDEKFRNISYTLKVSGELPDKFALFPKQAKEGKKWPLTNSFIKFLAVCD